jgi:S1-C subfamily serine protease
VRRAAVLGGVAAVLVGCGGQTKTVTVVTSAPSLTAAPSIVTTRSPVAGTVIARVKRSVLPLSCDTPNDPVGTGFVGTGFRVRNGVVTASHVVAACSPGTTISPGDGTGTVSTDDPTRDLALLTYQSPPFQEQSLNPNPKPLRLESGPAYVGEPLALLGVPALPLLGNPFTRQVTVVPGNVIATNRTQQLTPAEGGREILKGAIEVAAPGVLPGESGGPAIDAAGKVVGVIEGGGPGVATLTPVADLTSLR